MIISSAWLNYGFRTQSSPLTTIILVSFVPGSSIFQNLPIDSQAPIVLVEAIEALGINHSLQQHHCLQIANKKHITNPRAAKSL